MSRRHLVADLSGIEPVAMPIPVRLPAPDDLESLAALMLDAYHGTVDADGDETLEMARDEVSSFLAGQSGKPLLEHSRVAVKGRAIVSAVLISLFEDLPLVAYTYTGAAHKGRGLAEGMLRLAMASLRSAGHERVHLWVTAGNQPAERIYVLLGFVSAEPDLAPM